MKLRAAILGIVSGAIVLLLIIAFTYPANAKLFTYAATVVRVLDGDTVKVTIDEWPESLREQSVRLDGIDTAETGGKAKCEAERLKAAEAKAFVQKWLPLGSQVVIVYDTLRKDKYNGRILSDIYFQRRSLAAALKEAGLARPYDGGKKSDWCKGN